MVSSVELRAQAEQNLNGSVPPVAALSTADSAKLLHELQIRQIELDIQNENLRKLQIELEQARDRYIDLFDYAPVGYLSLALDGTIVDANMTASLMLSVEHGDLPMQAFASFVSTDDSHHWHQGLGQLHLGAHRKSCCLKLVAADESAIHVRMHMTQVFSGSEGPIRAALVDLSEQEYLAQSGRDQSRRMMMDDA